MKKILSFFLTVCLVISTFATLSFAEGNEPIDLGQVATDGTTATPATTDETTPPAKSSRTALFASPMTRLSVGGILVAGNGSADYPMLIETAEHLAQLGLLYNTDALPESCPPSGDTLYITLNDDLDFSDTPWSTDNAFDPAKNPTVPNIIFDGAGHVIRNLHGDSGLFSIVSLYSSVKNLGIENCNIAKMSGNVGAIANDNRGTIENCYVTGKVDADLGGAGTGGGIAFANYYTIQNCVAALESIDGTNDAGRIAGLLVYGTLGGNLAWVGTKVNGATVTGTATNKNGADKTAAELAVAANWPADFDTIFADAAPWANLPAYMVAPAPPLLGDGLTDGTAYQIKTIADLEFMRDKANAGDVAYTR